MAEAESEKSTMIEDEDLEDGEIEDDDDTEDCVVVEVKLPEPQKTVVKDSKDSPQKKKSSQDSHHNKKSSSGSASSSRKDKSNQDEDDFMSNIENAIAENLKKSGIEPPMPNVKKHSEPEQEPDRRQSRNNRKRRKRERPKERKEQKRENNSKKRSKVSDNDGFYMVGGSPNQSGSDTEEETSNSSYDSEEYHRSTYEERRNKRREKYASNHDRERERDRGGKKEKKSRETEKEVCLRFADTGRCPEENCQRSHEVRQPKKMELCKFWLMECCAKKDKCSYMHGDFPCKYYYLGLKCIHKECKFSHGRPLSENLKQILLKHLDTAPKEILGDFPRIGRENAKKMMDTTHVKLCQEFNVPLPETEKAKIPSLLEMNIKPPHLDFKNDKKANKNSSRWLQNESNSPSRDSPQRSTAAKKDSHSVEPGDVVLADLRGILSEKQIESMAAIGVVTVNHINNLTVAQLNDLGLSLATIGEIQATAMNMDKSSSVKTEKVKSDKEDPKEMPSVEDIDLREPPAALQNLDVDMRVVPTAEAPESAKSPDTIMSPNQSDVDDGYKKPEAPPRPSSSNVIMSPPCVVMSGLDYSQYLKDSNLNNDDEVEDEPGLRIDETYCTSDYEMEDKKDSQSEDDQQSQDEAMPKFEIPLLPPSFDTSNFLKSTPVVTKIDISSSVSQLMEKETPKPADAPSPSRDPRMRDPRMSLKASPSSDKETSKIPEISSPTYHDPRQKTEIPRTSIYEIESPSEDEDLIKIDRDKDMRLPFLRDAENGDVDLRFPFTPMSNYVPATEIEASYGTYIFEKYEVKVIDIPKPDYSEIKRSFRQTENTQDPRLKKLCGLQEEATKTGLANILPMDPRKRKHQEMKDDVPSAPKRLQISSILQNSKHYNELSSSQKMIVNEVLAELSKQLKLFHADSSSNKIFDSSFVTQRPKLQQILIGLGVFVNADGEFEEIKDMPMVTIPNIHQLPPPMITNLPPPSLMTLNQPPPNFLGGNMRPGLLGIAPNLPFGNFEPQEGGHRNFPPMNQGMPFGDQFNRDFGSNQNNRRDQRQQNSNFRNNSNRNNNNYSRHRRN